MLIIVSFWPQKLEFENMLMSMLINKPDILCILSKPHLPLRVLGRHVGERVVRLVVTLVQPVPLPARKEVQD